LAVTPLIVRIFYSFPHPLIEIWLIWFVVFLFQLHYLFKKREHTRQLAKSGEIMNFREIFAVGCVGGFILLSFITAFCTYLVMKTKDIL